MTTIRTQIGFFTTVPTGVFWACCVVLWVAAGCKPELKPQPPVVSDGGETSSRPRVVTRMLSEIRDYETLSAYEQTVAIRRWAAKNIDVSDPSHLLDQTSLHTRSLDENVDELFDDQGGHFCSGVAYLLTRLYREAGFKSIIYSYGFRDADPPAITHATTLVEVEGVWYVQDAYFDFSFEEGGRPVPFFEVLSNLADEKTTATQMTGAIRDYHSSFEKNTSPMWTPKTTAVKQLGEKHFIHRAHLSYDGFVEIHPYGPPTFDLLDANDCPRDLHYLLLFPMAVNAGPNLHYITKRSDDLVLNHIHYHSEKSLENLAKRRFESPPEP